MKLSHLADYAVVLMTAAARFPAGERLSATTLADETGVPLPTTQKLMGQLAANGLLRSHRGSGGGFVLARPADAISLADIVEAVEGPIAMTMCSGSDEASDCALDAHCRVKPHMGVVSHAVRGALGAVSLDKLAAPAPAHPEEGLSSPKGVAKARLEGRVLRDAGSTGSPAPQHERTEVGRAQ